MKTFILIILYLVSLSVFANSDYTNTFTLGKVGATTTDKEIVFRDGGCFKFNETSNFITASHDCSTYFNLIDWTDTSSNLTTSGTGSFGIVTSTTGSFTGLLNLQDALNFAPITTPSSPSTGLKVYAKSDDKLYTLTTTGTETEVGSGSGAGVPNYITNSDFEVDLSDWYGFDDSGVFVDGTGGSLAGTFTRETATPMFGVAHAKWLTAASTYQGRGISTNFTIDNQDRAKRLTITIPYIISSNAVDDDFAVYIYDITNAKIINVDDKSMKAGNGTYIVGFQTSPDSTSYRLSIMIDSNTSLARTIEFDNVNVSYGEPAKGQMSFKNEWQVNMTYNVSGSTASLPVTNYDPDSIVDSLGFTSSYGTFTIKKSFFPSEAPLVHCGSGKSAAFSSDELFNCAYVSSGDTGSGWGYRMFMFRIGGTGFSTTAFNLYFTAKGDDYKEPINTLMSNDATQREYTEWYTGTTGTALTANVTPINFTTELRSTHGSFSGTTLTAAVSGQFSVDGILRLSAASVSSPKLYVSTDGGSSYGQVQILGDDANTIRKHFSGNFHLNQGDKAQIRMSGSVTVTASPTDNWVSWRKDGDPSTISASERIFAKYYDGDGDSLTNNATEIVDFDTKVEDTHNAVTTGVAWKFTAPRSDLYQVCTGQRTATGAPWTIQEIFQANTYLNGSLALGSLMFFNLTQATHTREYGGSGCTNISMVKGEYVDVRDFQNSGSNLALLAGSQYTWITIEARGI